MANGTSTAPQATFTQVALRVPPIDYTSRDFESSAQDMVRTIPFFAPEWTDHNLSDFGIVLQRLTAYVADILHFYIDRVANEAFLPTAITRRSVGNLLQLINYELRSAVPASVDLTFTLTESLPDDLLIPRGFQVQTTADATDEPIIFEGDVDCSGCAGPIPE
jgi:predicted phage baseplate assembly protein